MTRERIPIVQAWLQDMTEDAKLDFVHDAVRIGEYPLPLMVGYGAAVLHLDGDGRLDLLLLMNGSPDFKPMNRLFKNMPDGTFRMSTPRDPSRSSFKNRPKSPTRRHPVQRQP